MATNIQEVSTQAAAERREKRKLKVLENAGHMESINSRVVTFEEKDDQEAFEIQYVEPKYFESISPLRLSFFVSMGVLLRILIEFGALATTEKWLILALTFCISYGAISVSLLMQKKVRYPKHGYAVNSLLCCGLNEELVIVIGFMLDVIWEMMLDSLIATIGFTSLHGLILLGKHLYVRLA